MRSRGADPVVVTVSVVSAILVVGLVIFVLALSQLPHRNSSPIAAASEPAIDDATPEPAIASAGAEPVTSSETMELVTASVTPRSSVPVAVSPAVRSPAQPLVYSTEELVARTQASVAIIATPTGSGSGFMVAPHVLATNYHVIADAPSDSIQVYFPDAPDQNRGPFAAAIVGESPNRDLALLRIDIQVPELEVIDDYTFRRGQDVVIIGSPGLLNGKDILPNAVTKGVLSSQARFDGHDVYQLSLAVNSGNSGGPVLGMDGRVIGVVVAKSLSEEAIGFSIPSTDLAALMNQEASRGYAVSREAVAMHDARALVRAVTKQNLERELILNRFIEIADIESSVASAAHFVSESKAVLAKTSPDLIRSFDRDFEELIRDGRLPSSVRRELGLLQQRHLAIEALLASPPIRVDRFMSDLSRLNVQYLRQLKSLDRSLEIGRPELFTTS